MKFAVPVTEGRLCMHFGHCETFAILDGDTVNKEIGPVNEVVPPPHEPGLLPRWLDEMGVKIVIAGGMGHRAKELFAQKGITVITGAPALTPFEVVSAYLAGGLTTGANPCDH